jgi:hypothetical protein
MANRMYRIWLPYISLFISNHFATVTSTSVRKVPCLRAAVGYGFDKHVTV